MNRRGFLKLAGISLAGVVTGGAGMEDWAARASRKLRLAGTPREISDGQPTSLGGVAPIYQQNGLDDRNAAAVYSVGADGVPTGQIMQTVSPIILVPGPLDMTGNAYAIQQICSASNTPLATSVEVLPAGDYLLSATVYNKQASLRGLRLSVQYDEFGPNATLAFPYSVNNQVLRMITGTPTSGTFKLKYDGVLTAALNWNCSQAQVVTALNAIPALAGLVSGSSALPGPFPSFPIGLEFAAPLTTLNTSVLLYSATATPLNNSAQVESYPESVSGDFIRTMVGTDILGVDITNPDYFPLKISCAATTGVTAWTRVTVPQTLYNVELRPMMSGEAAAVWTISNMYLLKLADQI